MKTILKIMLLGVGVGRNYSKMSPKIIKQNIKQGLKFLFLLLLHRVYPFQNFFSNLNKH